MSQSSPEQFGKYELLKRLAFGGMAEIFLARLRGEGGFSKQLVVKRILPQFGEDTQFVKMFIDEAVLAAHINHPNVVQIYDFGSTDNVYFIAMEHVDGADLRQILRSKVQAQEQMSYAQVAAIGEGAAAGLACAHAAVDPDGAHLHIVHRDVSPHNIMVGRSGDVKVMDFGIAKAEVRATKTATGTIKGKVAYMAPEHGAGEKADGRSDQFSLGAVLWECVAGERLYGGDSELEVLRNVLDCRVRPIESVRPGVPAELAGIINGMLSREPSERLASMTEVKDALSRFRYTLGPDGAVDLGKLVPPPSLKPAARATGTLVLDEPQAEIPTASEPVSPREQPSLSVQTVTGPDVSLAPPGTATLPMEGEPTRRSPQEIEYQAEKKASKLWAVLLLLLVAGALGWISHQGRSRMAADNAKVAPVPAATVVVTVTSEPSGARVVLNNEVSEFITPATLPPAVVGVTLNLELRLAGHKAWRHSFAADKDNVLQSAILEKLAVQTTRAQSTKPTVRGNKKAKKAPPRKTKVRPSKSTAQEPGRLFLRSSGLWFHVYLNGKKIGTTPLAGVSVPAGAQTLVLKNSVAAVERTIDIQVEPGAVVRRTVQP